MELAGSCDLNGSKQDVWDALNTHTCLLRIIPGCTEIVPVGEDAYKAKIVTRVGPLKVNFSGRFNYQDKVPFDSFQILGKGEGGPAGFAKGSVSISLEAQQNGVTRLSYNVQSSIGGKIASLGGRLLEAISRRNVDLFFTALQAELDSDSDAPARDTDSATSGISRATVLPPVPASRGSILPLVNTLSFVAIAIALWVIALQ